VSNARELAAMRTRIWPALTAVETRGLNWAAIANAAAEAFDNGWTGFEVGSAAIENLGDARNLGAVMVANIRAMGDPHREATPTPPPIDRAAIAKAQREAASQPSEWAAKVRAGLR
jgi:hypothetical protein